MKPTRIFEPFFGKKQFQTFFRKLHLFALYGMNYGRSGEINTSGEKQVFDLIKKQFTGTSGGTYLDCGANVGEYSLELAANIPKDSLIYAFEPGTSAFRTLVENSERVGNIHPIQKGVGDKNGSVALFSNVVTSKHSSLIPRDMSHWDEKLSLKDSETIELIRLDSFLLAQNISHVNFIKLDVEGYEMNCLLGLGDYLHNGKIDIIQFEFGVATIDAKYFFKDFYHLLNPEYKIYRILKNGFYQISNYNEVLEVFITTNYLAVSRKLQLKNPI